MLLSRLMLLGTVAQHFDKALDVTDLIPQRHHLAVGPETRVILASMPALVGATVLAQSGPHLGLGHPSLAVFLGEDHVGGPAQHLHLGPAEDAAGTLVPFQHSAVEVERDNRILHDAVQDHAVPGDAALHPPLGRRKLSPQLLDFGLAIGVLGWTRYRVRGHRALPPTLVSPLT